MTNMHRILLATALCQGLSACQMTGEPIISESVPSIAYVEKQNSICPDLTGVYESWARSAERSNYSGEQFEAGLAGIFLAGRVVDGRWIKRADGRPILERFDYVRLDQNGNKSIKITVGYADEDQPKGSKEVPLNDEKRRCEGNFIETFTKKKGGGEGFSSTINIQTTIRKDQDGSIVAIETWTQSKTVASIPIGSDTQTFTYRFKPWVPRHQ